ncbi:hypothetical protein DL95DRAFT_490501 [Leptodontidium sp. 2 PMI_412]|nr:hypothetical protein DL95DRAFT_490501 [Leptodontidium sp. 2 PMI_412]
MPYGGADYALGERPSNGALSLISPRKDEQRLVSLVAGVDRILDRCEEIMLHTSRSLFCWLRSTKPQTYYPKPFALVSLKASKTKYRRYFKRFIAFVFRDNGVLDWGLHTPLQGETEREEEGEDGDEEEEEEEEEEEAATSWGGEKSDSDGEWEEEEEEEEEGDRGTGIGDVLNGPTSQLLELLFKLSMTFSIAQFLDAQPSSSLLDFLPAKKYTPCLSGLIYIQRLLFLEYALPLRAYPHLRIPRRSRLQQYKRFDGVRLRYIIIGS